MPSKSKKQHDTMVIAAKDAEFARKMGIDQQTAREFVEKDKEAGLWQENEDSSSTESLQRFDDRFQT